MNSTPRKHRVVLLGLLAGAAFPALAQGPAFSAPTLGFLRDPSSAGLRPVMGLPGAASVGDTIDLGFGYSSLLLSPRHDYVLATTEDRQVLLSRVTR